jgi:hypothetical protein
LDKYAGPHITFENGLSTIFDLQVEGTKIYFYAFPLLLAKSEHSESQQIL